MLEWLSHDRLDALLFDDFRVQSHENESVLRLDRAVEFILHSTQDGIV